MIHVLNVDLFIIILGEQNPLVVWMLQVMEGKGWK